MQQEYYPYQHYANSLRFEFTSKSSHKTVNKVVIYTPFEKNNQLYNLALVDALPDGSFDDKSVTNNLDMKKVLATVVRTIFHFFDKYPTKLVYIEGSTPERTRLYRIIISAEIDHLENILEIWGIKNSLPELFRKNQNYDAYVIKSKNKLV